MKMEISVTEAMELINGIRHLLDEMSLELPSPDETHGLLGLKGGIKPTSKGQIVGFAVEYVP